MADIAQARKALVARILEGNGSASHAQRRAAFDNVPVEGPVGTLLAKVAAHAYQVTDEEVLAVRGAGLSEDQIFELVICSAVGEATRQYEAGMAALRAAGKRE